MKALSLIALFSSFLLFGGCASTPRRVELPRPISMAEVKEMSAKGVTDETIIAALRATRAAYYLKSEHVTDLQQAGVSQAVIDYLLSTPQLFPPQPPPVYYYPDPFYNDPFYWHGFHHHGFHHHFHFRSRGKRH